ncbi:hypothetical protein L1077_06445 [Pseudoalteromonas luteoviolacea]|uniref:ATP-grasp domain-containing protein n=1 Tax=Pseudoalteromonas luteoviolacea TaxID=43657 RepID=UPI001F3A7C30|nr:hypothetical protein [Pseudoalteromonas luteoviolacea]MCF6439064.1 hypothetical protein [Pseudoalteromonas luteoviolacea]
MKVAICCYPGLELDKMISACSDFKLEYEVIDLLSNKWLELVNRSFDLFLIRPPCNYDEHKAIFDERVYFISQVLNKKTYPKFNELYVYENKRNMATWLEYLGYNFPATNVFAQKHDALSFIEQATFPIVSKANTGAGGSAVKIIKNRRTAKRLVNKVFGKLNPEFALGNIPWGSKNNIPFPRVSRAQRHYVLFQEFLDIELEWRIIRVGDSYFGHQKLIGSNGFASGSDLVGWVQPPIELLDMTRELTDRMDCTSMAVDILKTTDGKFYINELQSIFGSVLPSQMYIDDVPGKYIYDSCKREYVFVEGEYCQNACWNLRLECVINEQGSKAS